MRYLRHLMMMTAAFAAAGAATSALASSADSADTALNFCNRHDEKIFIAVAFDEPGDASAPPGGSAVAPKVFARGWWGIDAGACTKLTFPLVDDRILLFAQSASQTFNWIGDSSVCVDLTHAFEISDAANQACNGPNQGYRAFKVVNVPSLPAPAPDSVATYEFKTQDAVRVGGGLKFCNDTQDPVYLSFGQKRSRDTKFSVDGWFSIKPDNCYETTRDSSADEVWYYAQGGSGTLTWRGDTPLCTDDVKGYTFEDAANMPCTGTNQMMELFQRGVLAAAGQDFEHHFKVADAHKIRSQVDICNNRQEKIYVATAWRRPEFPDDVVTRGWYVVDQGKCVTKLPIDAPVVYVHAENEARANLLESTAQIEACVDNSLAFMFSQSNSMQCGTGNLVNAIFVPHEIAAGTARVDINVIR